MKNKSLHSIDTVFVLLLFALFVMMALFVSVSGALAYKKTAAQMDERFNKQTCISYITAKVRSNNKQDKIYVGDFNGINALCIKDSVGEMEYVTYIYQYDGMVRELFCNTEVTQSLDPSAGAALTEAKNLQFSKDGSLFEIKLTDTEDRITEFYVNSL